MTPLSLCFGLLPPTYASRKDRTGVVLDGVPPNARVAKATVVRWDEHEMGVGQLWMDRWTSN